MQTTIMMDKSTRRKIDAMSKADATTMAATISRAVDQMYTRRQLAGLLSRTHCAIGENYILAVRKAESAELPENKAHFQNHVDRLQNRLETMYKSFDCDAQVVERNIDALQDKPASDISEELAALTARHEEILENMGEVLAYLDGESLLEKRIGQ